MSRKEVPGAPIKQYSFWPKSAHQTKNHFTKLTYYFWSNLFLRTIASKTFFLGYTYTLFYYLLCFLGCPRFSDLLTAILLNQKWAGIPAHFELPVCRQITVAFWCSKHSNNISIESLAVNESIWHSGITLPVCCAHHGFNSERIT